MKRYFTARLTVMLVLLTLSICGRFAGEAGAQVPGIITYHGVIESNGNKYDGSGQFKFALVNDGQPLLATYWSNDGTLDGSEPATFVTVTVDKGLFTVPLGDTTLNNMLAIPAGVFANANVHLRVWFREANGNGNGNAPFVLLTPDQRITAVGYAMMAAGLAQGAVGTGNLADGSVTTIKIADQAVTGTKLAPQAVQTEHLGDGAVTTPKLADGAVTTPKLADGAVTAAKIAAGAVTTQKIGANAVTSDKVADVLTLETLNLGGVSWDGTLNMYSKPVGGGGLIGLNGEPRGSWLADDLGSELSLLFGDGNRGAWLSARSPGGSLELRDTDGNNPTVELNAGGNSGGFLTLRNPSGLSRAFLQGGGAHDGGELQLRDNTGANRLRLYGNAPAYSTDLPSGGGVDLLDLSGNRRIAMRGGDGTIHLPQANGTEGVFLTGRAFGGAGGVVRVRQDAGGLGVQLQGQTTGTSGGQISAYDAQNDLRVFLRGENGTLELRDESGVTPTLRATGDLGQLVALSRVGVANSVDAALLKAGLGLTADGGLVRTRDENDGVMTEMGAATGGGYASVYHANGNSTVRILGAQTSTSGGRLEMSQADGSLTVILDGEVGEGGGGFLQLRNAAGESTITLDSDFAGDGRVTTQVLEITGGSDLSENFDIQSPDAQPGMIVSIDPAHPGELSVSARAYDRTVAGVVSGAGGVRTGMLMGQRGTKADGKHPVALTGRVYCLVDADKGAIEPGDLITTSETPGHGMKVSDHARAQGAIIGKAMGGLSKGKGLVMILVNLQ